MSAPLITILDESEVQTAEPVRVDVALATLSQRPHQLEAEQQFSVEWEVPEAS
jgi:hypothetical protein